MVMLGRVQPDLRKQHREGWTWLVPACRRQSADLTLQLRWIAPSRRAMQTSTQKNQGYCASKRGRASGSILSRGGGITSTHSTGPCYCGQPAKIIFKHSAGPWNCGQPGKITTVLAMTEVTKPERIVHINQNIIHKCHNRQHASHKVENWRPLNNNQADQDLENRSIGCKGECGVRNTHAVHSYVLQFVVA